MNRSKKNEVLSRLYGNHELYCGLSSIRKLYNEGKKYVPNPRYEDVKNFLSSQNSYTLHKQGRRHFPRRKIIVARPKLIVSVDLADMSLLKEHNDGVRYLLFALDSFSRYLIIKPLRNKNADSVLQAVKSVFESDVEGFADVKRIFCDKGREWYNAKVISYLKKKTRRYILSKIKKLKQLL